VIKIKKSKSTLINFAKLLNFLWFLQNNFFPNLPPRLRFKKEFVLDDLGHLLKWDCSVWQTLVKAVLSTCCPTWMFLPKTFPFALLTLITHLLKFMTKNMNSSVNCIIQRKEVVRFWESLISLDLSRALHKASVSETNSCPTLCKLMDFIT